MKEPITVAELIARLQQCDPASLVMIECEDTYYSGAVERDDISEGRAGIWEGRAWVIAYDNWAEVKNHKPCVIIYAGG